MHSQYTGRDVWMLLELFKYILNEPLASVKLLEELRTTAIKQSDIIAGLKF